MNAINPERLASQPYQGNSDVFVLLNSTADEESTYDLMKSTPFTEEKKQKLYNISGVKDVYELYMLDGILTNSEGEKFELSIENAVNPETFKMKLLRVCNQVMNYRMEQFLLLSIDSLLIIRN